MPTAYRSHRAPVQKLIVIGQVHESKPGPSYHPLEMFKRWVDKHVDGVFQKLIEKGWGPKTPDGQGDLPFKDDLPF